MSERWIDIELRQLSQQCEQSTLPGADPVVAAFAGNCVLLIAEVRRLRWLVERLGILRSQGWMANPDQTTMAELEAEARAIREEKGT